MATASDAERPTLIESLTVQVKRARRFYGPTVNAATAIAARREIGEFLKPRIPDMLAQVSQEHPADAVDSDSSTSMTALPVYSYWQSAPDAVIPDIVHVCRAHLRAVTPQAILLDDAGARERLYVPDYISGRVQSRWPAQYSDYLRVGLLEATGGCWVDATCYPSQNPAEAVDPLLGMGVIYPRWAGKQIGNWFIAAQPGNHLIALQRIALETWWQENDHLPDYFLYHRIFEVLLTHIPEALRLWRRVPLLSAIPAHFLQLTMMRRYDAEDVANILAATFIHKLSYKYDPEDVPTGSVLATLLEQGTL